jgi:colicin import membrane protein
MNIAVPRDDLTAGVLAAAVHGFFVLLLVLGVSWQIHDPQPVMADLWQALPALPQDAPLPPPLTEPPPEPAPVPKPVAPVPKPQPEPKPVVEDKTADIALEKKKKKQEEEKQRKLKQEEASEKKRLEQKRREEAKRMEEELEREAAHMEAEQLQREQARKLAEIKRREALKREEEEMLRSMMEESLASETSQIRANAAAGQQASEMAKIIARYKEMISAKIRGNTRLPENLSGNPEVEFEVNVLPTGEIVKVRLSKGSGNAAYDTAVQRGIEKSSPLPMPPDKAAAAEFRNLVLKHKARE